MPPSLRDVRVSIFGFWARGQNTQPNACSSAEHLLESIEVARVVGRTVDREHDLTELPLERREQPPVGLGDDHGVIAERTASERAQHQDLHAMGGRHGQDLAPAALMDVRQLCGRHGDGTPYCPYCGAKMGEENKND